MSYDERWTWECIRSHCEKREAFGKIVTLETCNVLCEGPQLWPKPKLKDFKRKVIKFSFDQFEFKTNASNISGTMIKRTYNIFREDIKKMIEDTNSSGKSDVQYFLIQIQIVNSNISKLRLNISERYNLTLKYENNNVICNIDAANFFGARHGLETLSQLIWWNKVKNGTLLTLEYVNITDWPSFSYRGLMIDTARNFFPLEQLKNVLVGMAANKLNTFHWHITDMSSFPYKSKKYPQFAEYGAYNPNLTYSQQDIEELVEFAKIRGIRTVLELDVPNHVGDAWTWGPSYNLGNLIMCNKEAFTGQLNASNPNVLTILEGLYSELLTLNEQNEIFHIGGDEVDAKCWSSINNNVYQVWGSYMQKILSRLKSANHDHMPDNVVMWSSTITELPFLSQYFEKSNVVIQSWLGAISIPLKDGFKVIISSVRPWYLDCGFGRYRESMGEGNCDPYTPWQSFYSFYPWSTLPNPELILGGEVCLWSEQVDVDSLETRLWPRSAAFAERIWSDPQPWEQGIKSNVYTRLTTQRQRLIGRGIKAEAMWPMWCTQNPGKC